MFKEISEEFVVRTLQNYAIYTDTNRNEVRRLYSQLATKQTWENREDIIKAVSLGKGAGEIVTTHSNIVKDLSYIYERFHDLYMEDLRNTRIRIRHVGEIQETMDRIEACYKALSPSEEYIVLMYLYEVNETYSAGLIDAEKKLKMSERSIKRRRKRAIEKIMELYYSDMTNTAMLLSSGFIE